MFVKYTNQAILHREAQILRRFWWVSTTVSPNDQPEPVSNEEREFWVVPL